MTKEDALNKGLEIDLLDLTSLTIKEGNLISVETGEKMNMKPFGEIQELRFFNEGLPTIGPIPQDAEGYLILGDVCQDRIFSDHISLTVQFYKSD